MGNPIRDNNHIKMGRLIRQYREKSGITQDVFGNMVGISRPYLCYLENGQRRFGLDLVLAFARIMYPGVESDTEKLSRIFKEAGEV